MRAILETDCLCKAYVNRDTGKTIALSDVSLQIPHSAFYGILGESGSGKSTLAALLSGYETPDRGNIRLNGRCLCGLSRKEWRIIYQDLQLVFQNAPLSFNPRMRFARVLLQAKRQQGASPEAQIDALYPIMEALALPRSLLDCYPHEVSGGECQRMAIARALAAEPSVLILDEATSALDARIAKQTLDMLQTYQQEHGLTILFISHSIALAQTYCSHIAIMKNGCFVEAGAASNVLASPNDSYIKRLIEDAIPFL